MFLFSRFSFSKKLCVSRSSSCGFGIGFSFILGCSFRSLCFCLSLSLIVSYFSSCNFSLSGGQFSLEGGSVERNLHSSGFSFSICSSLSLLGANFFNLRGPPGDFRLDISNINESHIVTIAFLFTHSVVDFSSNESLWLASHGVLDCTSNQVLSLIKHFHECSNVRSASLEFVTIEDITFWAGADTSVLSTMVRLWVKEWLTEALEIIV